MGLTAGTILGQYEIRSPLGAGGMGAAALRTGFGTPTPRKLHIWRHLEDNKPEQPDYAELAASAE
jgi:hypothetical protein